MSTDPVPVPEAAVEAADIREGDIYRWRWADASRDADNAPYRSYHCCSRLAVVRNGQLVDTFWFGNDNKVLAPDDVILERLGNIADLVEIKHYDVPYYRREDVVDMRHSNNSSGPIYRRKGAQRDQATMLALLQERAEMCRRDIAYNTRRLEELLADAEKVRAGNLHEVYL